MRRFPRFIMPLVMLLLVHASALAQYAPERAPEGPPPTEAEMLPLPAVDSELFYEPGPCKDVAPDMDAWTKEYPGGQWVYTTEYGWLGVSDNTTTVAFEGVPYVYLYTPAWGWTWYVSPWGPGPYYYGSWVRHVWHPAGWHHGFIAHPRARRAMPHHANTGPVMDTSRERQK